ncbi:MAG: hypothetical protein KC800_01280 [Candidatus Eremiobacteraeota bacterium]|nr:hypothetical protein [Candidatus Eremiobacteraeota bacterium]
MRRVFSALVALLAGTVGVLCLRVTIPGAWIIQTQHASRFEKTQSYSKLLLNLDFWLQELQALMGLGTVAILICGLLLMRSTVSNPESNHFELTLLAIPCAFIAYGLMGVIAWAQVSLVFTALYGALSLPMLLSLLKFYIPWFRHETKPPSQS